MEALPGGGVEVRGGWVADLGWECEVLGFVDGGCGVLDRSWQRAEGGRWQEVAPAEKSLRLSRNGGEGGPGGLGGPGFGGAG